MEREQEVKILGIDPVEMEERLVARGAQFIGEEWQQNEQLGSAYLTANGDPKSYFRIRTAKTETGESRTELTYKRHQGEDQVRHNEEYNVRVSDGETLKVILDALGVTVVQKGFKHRRSFLYGGARFDIDIWDEASYPEPYMEIEVASPTVLAPLLEDLEIDPSQVSTMSIAELKQNHEILQQKV